MRSRNKWDAIEELVDHLVEAHEIRILDRREVLDAVCTRERTRSTGLDNRVALPHGRSRIIEDVIGVLGVSVAGIPFESTDGQDTQLICLLVFPETQSRDHLGVLSEVARTLSDGEFRDQLFAAVAAGDAESLLRVVQSAGGLGLPLTDGRYFQPSGDREFPQSPSNCDPRSF
jgi:PTS system fructose-specific IIA component/PTS system nitrogen regulatory IIA component